MTLYKIWYCIICVSVATHIKLQADDQDILTYFITAPEHAISSSFWNNKLTNKALPTPQKTEKAKEVVHANGYKTINYFDKQGRNKSRIETDANNNMNSFINFYEDGTQSKTIYHAHKTQTVSIFGSDNKSRSITEFDAQNKPITSIEFHDNGSQTQTTYNHDGTKKAVLINPDGTYVITILHPDTTQTIDSRSQQGHRISLTRIQLNGTRVTATDKLITAWHEAGHAIARIYKDTLSVIDHITIQPEAKISVNGQPIKTSGHVQSIQTYQTHKSPEELENQIIAALCGAIAEQILMQEKMLSKPEEILQFLAGKAYTEDMLIAYKDAQNIIDIQTFQHTTPEQLKQKIDELIVQLYKKSYQFLMLRKGAVQKIAETLMKQETLHTDETYNLIHADKPLMAYEQGPLPFNLTQNYTYRGWRVT